MTTAAPFTKCPAGAASAVPSRPAAPTNGRAARSNRSYWATLTVIGVVGGVLSGLFAIGGAILMVPLLVWRAGMDQRRAAATSLVAIVPPGIVSSLTYLAHGDVNVIAGVWIGAGAIVGAVIGSRLLNRMPLIWLSWVFIAFLLIVALNMVVVTPHRDQASALSPAVVIGYVTLGVLTGIASGLFGIGGAIITVPMLVSGFALSDLVAKGTALLVGIPTSIAGTISNRRNERVDVRAGLVLGVAAAAAAVPAVYLAVAIPAKVSAVLFAGLLLAVATQLAVKAVRAGREQHA